MRLVCTNVNVTLDRVDITLRFEDEYNARLWIVKLEYQKDTPVKITHEPPESYSEDELNHVREVTRRAKGNSEDVWEMISQMKELNE
jgi:hypothetical protein